MKKWLSEILNIFSAKWVYEHLNYIVFLALLTFAYIANSHYWEKKLRKKHVLEKQVDEAYWEYMNAKSKLMKASTMSNLESVLAQEQISIDGELPQKLIVK